MEFGPKVLVNYDYFRDRVKPSAQPGIVFIGYRCLAAGCRIEPAGKRESYRSMIADCAVGLALFQGLEFVLHSNPFELVGKARVGLSRLANATPPIQTVASVSTHPGARSRRKRGGSGPVGAASLS